MADLGGGGAQVACIPSILDRLSQFFKFPSTDGCAIWPGVPLSTLPPPLSKLVPPFPKILDPPLYICIFRLSKCLTCVWRLEGGPCSPFVAWPVTCTLWVLLDTVWKRRRRLLLLRHLPSPKHWVRLPLAFLTSATGRQMYYCRDSHCSCDFNYQNYPW